MLNKVLVVTMFASLAALPASAKTAKAAGPTDPQIAHIAVTANQVDVDAGKQALGKSQNPAVRKFAQQMIDDHQSVIQKATALVKKLGVTPEDNPTSQSLKSSGEKARAELAPLSGAAFDKAYADNEVAYHKEVIHAVDSVLIPNARNAKLKKLLEQVRPVLAAHLKHAQSLQKSLGAK